MGGCRPGERFREIMGKREGWVLTGWGEGGQWQRSAKEFQVCEAKRKEDRGNVESIALNLSICLMNLCKGKSFPFEPQTLYTTAYATVLVHLSCYDQVSQTG